MPCYTIVHVILANYVPPMRWQYLLSRRTYWTQLHDQKSLAVCDVIKQTA